MRPLTRAHAHGDCAHPRPLLDALDQGFCSIEADIYLVDGEILVGHDRKDLRPWLTLENLYLDPLQRQVAFHRGHVYEEPATVILLLDLKDEGEGIYDELRGRLPRYRPMLTEYLRVGKEEIVETRAVTVLLSGDRPVTRLRSEVQRLAFIDGRLPDLDDPTKLNPNLIPMVSDDFARLFRWDGDGEIPLDEHRRLLELCGRAHAAGSKIRFWGSPDNERVWETLYDAGVDFLNADNLFGLSRFLNSKF